MWDTDPGLGLGGGPPPMDQALAGAPNWGGLPPSIPQAMGWAPPGPAPAPDSTPPPIASLPSMQGQPPAPSAGGPAPSGPDYQVPLSAFGHPGGPQPPPGPGTGPRPTASAPAKPPPTFDQSMANLQQREQGTEQAQVGAINAGVEAQKSLHADQLGAYQQAWQTVEANASARKAEDEQSQKIYATIQAKVDADRKQIDSWKFNRSKFLDDLGVGGKVRWGIGMVLAGIGQGMMRQGGANPVVEMLQQNIHDANEAQYKARDALVQDLGFDRQSGQDAAAYHAARQAEIDKKDGLAYTALAKQLEEAAVKSADPIARANGLKEAANVREMGDERLKSYIQLQSEHEHQQQQIGIQRQQVGIAAGELALHRKHETWEENKEQQELDLKAAALLAKKDGKLSEEESKRAIFIPGPDGKPIPATRQDGTVVLAADPADAGKIRRQVASTSTYNALIGKMTRGITDHGGESDWWHSKDWQDMKTDYKAAVAELHEAYGIQSFREPTIEFFDKMTAAGLDPTSFNKVRDNASEALRNSNRNIQLKMNGLLGAQGYDRAPVQWADTTNPLEPELPDPASDEGMLKDALKNPHRKVPGGGKYAPQMGRESAADTTSFNEQLDRAGGVDPNVRQNLATWGGILRSPDAALRARAVGLLTKTAEESESPETAAFARQILEQHRKEQMDATPGTPELVRGSSGAPRPIGAQ